MDKIVDVKPEFYDVFRNDLIDVPEDACSDDIACAVGMILEAIGEDVEREGLLKTPDRVSRMYGELTAGYHVDPDRLINDAIFNVQYEISITTACVSIICFRFWVKPMWLMCQTERSLA